MATNITNAATSTNAALNTFRETLNAQRTSIDMIRGAVDGVRENVREIPTLNQAVGTMGSRATHMEEMLQALEQQVTNLVNELERTREDRGRQRTRGEPQTVQIGSRSPSVQSIRTAEREQSPSIFNPQAESTARPKSRTKGASKAEAATSFMNQTTAAGKDIPKGARTKMPDSFDGKRGKEAQTFLTKMGLYFTDAEEGTFNDNR
ncbi:hypothetical protein FRC12_012603 [Ceratobasidium sp. 428]|nr:hypothetical protein FRC12_012603 [Ceratobasidium sp. 428]